MLIAATGKAPTDRDREIYRNSLKSLVRLAKCECILEIELDMQDAGKAMRG